MRSNRKRSGNGTHSAARTCADNTRIRITQAVSWCHKKEDDCEESSRKHLGQETQVTVSLRNGILYRIRNGNCYPLRLFVSRIEFNRRMGQIARGNKTVRTMVFPSTVKEVRDEAFYFSRQLLSVILNDRLETIGSTRVSIARLVVGPFRAVSSNMLHFRRS